MPLTKERKKEIISDLEEKIKNHKVILFVNFKGLKMPDFIDLRDNLKNNDSKLMVAKKTLMGIAFKNNQIDIDLEGLKDEVAITFGFSDQISPAKTVYDFSQKNPDLKIIGGYLDGEIKTGEEIVQLAKLPSREQLIAQVVGTIKAPISGAVNVMQGNIINLIQVIKQVEAGK